MRSVTRYLLDLRTPSRNPGDAGPKNSLAADPTRV
jgi:hypothetical protein